MDAHRLPLWVKPLIWLLCLAPLAWLGSQVVLQPPVNPIEYLIRGSGLWSLRLLCLTLCLTPLRRLTGWAGWIRIRRLVGLFAFFYACLHLAAYVVFEQSFDVAALVRDVIKRPFITVGMLAFLLLLPLALTSTQAMMKRLGRRWKQIHSLIYLVAPLAVLHFWWMVKKDVSEPLLYLIVVAVLLGLRLWWRFGTNLRRS